MSMTETQVEPDFDVIVVGAGIAGCVVAYQLARDERLGEAALPSLALVAVGLVPVILLSRTLRSRT